MQVSLTQSLPWRALVLVYRCRNVHLPCGNRDFVLIPLPLISLSFTRSYCCMLTEARENTQQASCRWQLLRPSPVLHQAHGACIKWYMYIHPFTLVRREGFHKITDAIWGAQQPRPTIRPSSSCHLNPVISVIAIRATHPRFRLISGPCAEKSSVVPGPRYGIPNKLGPVGEGREGKTLGQGFRTPTLAADRDMSSALSLILLFMPLPSPCPPYPPAALPASPQKSSPRRNGRGIVTTDQTDPIKLYIQ